MEVSWIWIAAEYILFLDWCACLTPEIPAASARTFDTNDLFSPSTCQNPPGVEMMSLTTVVPYFLLDTTTLLPYCPSIHTTCERYSMLVCRDHQHQPGGEI